MDAFDEPIHARVRQQLSGQFEVHEVVHDVAAGEDRFMAWDGFDGRRDRLRHLPELLARLSRRPALHRRRREEDRSITQRREEVFWRYLVPRLGAAIWTDLGLQRHYMNDVIGRHSPWATDVDAVASAKSGLWALEIKHKFPFMRDGRSILGMNIGEVDLFDRLIRSDLKVLHVVVVKPHRDKARGSVELLVDSYARGRTKVLAIELDAETISRIRKTPLEPARNTGRDAGVDLATHRIPVSWFDDLGTLSDVRLPAAIADQLHHIKRGRCTDRELELVRLDRTP